MTPTRNQTAACVALALFIMIMTCVAPAETVQGLTPIRQYISSSWDKLTRSMEECEAFRDVKIRQVLWLPQNYPIPMAAASMQMDCDIDVEYLPQPIQQLGEIETSAIPVNGLLYLPNKYVVPNGRSTEMYGWDSYFIILGLLRDGRTDLARGMVENFFFEIEHYGASLSQNRWFYLSRSQPPFLTSMVLEVYQAETRAGHDGLAWLKKAYPYLEKDYALWTREPHLAGSTGLARYYDFGDGPALERLQEEGGYYRKAVSYFTAHPENATHTLIEEKAPTGPGVSFSVTVCDIAKATEKPQCEPQRVLSLSEDYFRGDRSMRESGFDGSFRFGPYGASTHHYAPVCLNSLLFKSEKDMEHIAELIGKREDVKKWQARAEARKIAMQKYLWSSAESLFFDYDFEAGKQSTFRYLTAYYPLWAGLATEEQARALVKSLPVFEQAGGLAMSSMQSGAQWDSPYGWAPVHLLVIQGLRRYGFNADADRLSLKFLSTVLQNFRREGTIREKYNVANPAAESKVDASSQANATGFGWTNAAFLELLHDLPKSAAESLEKEAPAPTPN